MKFKHLKTFEELSWTGNVLGQDIGELAEYDDGYFKMVLKDVDYEGSDMILHVNFFEVNNKKNNGQGKFKYSESDIKGLSSGDIIPIDMSGIIEDVFYDDEEIIFEFINRLVDQIR